MILKNPISLQDLINNSNNFFPDRIKFCIHKPTGTIAIDEEFHVDMEYELYDEVGEINNIYGGDLYFDSIKVVWEARPNVERNRELGTPRNGRKLTDEAIIDELSAQLKKFFL